MCLGVCAINNGGPFLLPCFLASLLCCNTTSNAVLDMSILCIIVLNKAALFFWILFSRLSLIIVLDSTHAQTQTYTRSK